MVKTRFCLSMATPTSALNWPGSSPCPGADIGQQLAFAIEDLKPVFHLVGHPDVPIAIHGDALGPGEVSGAIAMLAEEADEVSVGIEDLHAIVEGVGHVDIAVLVQRHALRRAKVAWRW